MRLNKFFFFLLSCAFAGAVFNQQIYELPVWGMLLDLVVVCVLSLALGLLISLVPYVRVALFPLVSAGGFAAAYFYKTFGVSLSYDSLAWLVEANRFEVNSFLTPSLMGILGAGIVFGFVQAWLSGSFDLKNRRLKFGIFVGVLACTVFVYKGAWIGLKHFEVQKIYEAISLSRIYPFSVPKAARMYLHEANEMQKMLNLPDPATVPCSALPQEDRPIVTFIIGESVQAYHLGINGYPRETTPRLAKEKNLLNFGVCRSFGNTTRVSLVGMLTDATIKKRKPRHGSFIKIYNGLGYRTAFYSKQNKIGRSGQLTDMLISCAQDVQYIHNGGGDFTLLDPLEHAANTVKGGQLILLHMSGSHFSYKKHYGDDFRKFVPDAYENENLAQYHDEVINAYDNTIYKLDSFLVGVMDKLRDKDAVLIYASDHGDSLGKRGVFLHGTSIQKEQYEVPLLIWYSDLYAQKHPEIVAGLRSSLGKSVSHDNLYHTILGLGGIQSQLLDPKLDLTRGKAI